MIRRILLFLSMVSAGALGYALLHAEKNLEPRGSSSGGRPEGDSDAERCASLTSSGQRCSRHAEPGSAYCWQHGDH